jgi:hypothetical protein
MGPRAVSPDEAKTRGFLEWEGIETNSQLTPEHVSLAQSTEH